MLDTTPKQRLFCFVLGVAIALLGIFTLAFTAAIAAPQSFFDWFRARGSLETGLLLWEATVVFGLGLGLPALLSLLAAFRFVAAPGALAAALFIVGVLLTAHVLVPLASGTPLSFALSRPWWGHGLEISVVMAALVALLFARRGAHRDRPAPRSVRSAA